MLVLLNSMFKFYFSRVYINKGGGFMNDCGNVQKVFVPVSDEINKNKSTSQKKQKKKTPINSIDVTDLAVKKIKEFLKKDGKSSKEFGLKVTVVKDGCSGNSYIMDLSSIQTAIDNNDKIINLKGATLIIDKLSYLFVIGSTLDYVESLLMSGFQLINPNVKGSCSCGSSFRV